MNTIYARLVVGLVVWLVNCNARHDTSPLDFDMISIGINYSLIRCQATTTLPSKNNNNNMIAS